MCRERQRSPIQVGRTGGSRLRASRRAIACSVPGLRMKVRGCRLLMWGLVESGGCPRPTWRPRSGCGDPSACGAAGSPTGGWPVAAQGPETPQRGAGAGSGPAGRRGGHQEPGQYQGEGVGPSRGVATRAGGEVERATVVQVLSGEHGHGPEQAGQQQAAEPAFSGFLPSSSRKPVNGWFLRRRVAGCR